jgi:hypothetical protein
MMVAMKVLYVGGTGRTGSTMLDQLLGCEDGWFSGGELAFIWSYGLMRGGRCSCGDRLSDCRVWSEILDRTTRLHPFDARWMVSLRRRFWSIHLPLTLSERITERRLDALREFPRVVDTLYASIGAVTGAKVLVDSSKEPHYSLILRERTSHDVYFLHLVRDPRATSHSWRKLRVEPGFTGTTTMERRGLIRAAAYYGVSNLAAEYLWRDQPDRYRLVRYEDLVADPAAIVEQIAEFVGEPLDLGQRLGDGVFRAGRLHTCWGNPNRFDSDPIEIRADDAWRGQQSRLRSYTAAILNPVALRYGYRWPIDGPLAEPIRNTLLLSVNPRARRRRG